MTLLGYVHHYRLTKEIIHEFLGEIFGKNHEFDIQVSSLHSSLFGMWSETNESQLRNDQFTFRIERELTPVSCAVCDYG
jgi:hypothetical protein